MAITLFGDSCMGKSTIVGIPAKQLSTEVYSGKDYIEAVKERKHGDGAV